MPTTKRSLGVLALVMLSCWLSTAFFVESSKSAALGTGQTPTAINTNQYLDMLARQCNNINALAQILENAQYQYLPMLPPAPDIGFTAPDELTPVNFTDFPAEFDFQHLIPEPVNGVPVFSIFIVTDPQSRDTVFLNGQGDILYRLPPPAGYDPVSWLMTWRPNLVPPGCTASNSSTWFPNLDFARIQVGLQIITADDVIPYCQAAAQAQSNRLLLAPQRALAPNTLMMQMSNDPCSITNESDPFAVLAIQPDTNGWMTLSWESCTGRVYAVEARADLLDSLGWVALASNVGEVGSTSWTDTDAPSFPMRFYRVQRQPYNFCSVSNCVLTNLVSGIPDWWLLANGYPVTTPFDTIAPNGLTLQKCYQDGTLPSTPVATPTGATVTGQIHRVVLGKCGFDEFTVNPTNVYLQSDIVGELENCGGLTNQYLTVSFNPTNGLPSTNGDMVTDFAITGSSTNSPVQLVSTNSNPASPEILTNTLSRLYETTLLTNLALNAFLANTNMTAVTNPVQCAAIRALTPDEKTNTLQRLDYWITFSSQAGVDYNVQWVEHTDFANGTSTNIFMTELVPGNGSTASTSNYPLALPSSYGTSTVMMTTVRLLVDTDRNGVVNDADELGKAQWTLARGALVPPREIVNGTNPIAGLAKIIIKPPGSVHPAGLTYHLRSIEENTLIYLGFVDANSNALDAAVDSYVFNDWPSTGLVIYAAAQYTRNCNSTKPKQFGLVLELVQTNDSTLGYEVIATDNILLTVAPVILPSECNPAEYVYSTMPIPGITNLIVLNTIGGGSSPARKKWTQDAVKFTKAQCSSDSMIDVFIDLGHPSSGNLSSVLRSNGLGGVTWPVDGDGGNIMATPPLSNAPYGKLLIGSSHLDSLPYWTNQNLQPVVSTLNTSWLGVGHIDETIMIIASNKVLIADPWKATDLLHSEIISGNGTNTIWFGLDAAVSRTQTIQSVMVATNSSGANKLANLLPPGLSDQSSLSTATVNNAVFDGGELLRIDNELLKVFSVNGSTITVERALGGSDATIHTNGSIVYALTDTIRDNLYWGPAVDTARTYLMTISNQLQSAFGSNNIEFIRVPVLFVSTNTGYIAISANIANCLLGVGGTLYYSDTGCNVFNNYMSNTLPASQPVDVWTNYHCAFGEIHCGTSALRHLEEAPQWWHRFNNWE